jgi:hypothetical protein
MLVLNHFQTLFLLPCLHAFASLSCSRNAGVNGLEMVYNRLETSFTYIGRAEMSVVAADSTPILTTGDDISIVIL